MHIITPPTLDEMPLPPPDKVGWPWTESCPHLAGTMPNGSSWPRISIVTPSYNQIQFIEETIRSVLLQGYPNLEYIVVDGGSTDGSPETIRRYEPWLAHWVSEPDRGQAHAINKGFALCTGDLLGWINSDDGLLPSALAHLAAAFRQFPQSILLSDVLNVDDVYGLTWLRRQTNVTFEALAEPGRHNVFWQQPGVYLPRALYQQVGELDETLRYVFDRDWMCRALQVAPVHYLHVPVARFRLHDTSKTVHEAAGWDDERRVVAERYWKRDGDTRISQAALSIHLAANHLRAHNWNRARGLEHLGNAVWQHWRALTLPGFWLLCLKASIPFSLLKMSRALRSRFYPSSGSQTDTVDT